VAEVVVQVQEYLKGSGPSTLKVEETRTTVTVFPGPTVEVHPASSAACGTFDHIGGTYLLFLYREHDGLHSGGVCGGSTEITEYNGAQSRIEEVRGIVAAQAAQISVFPNDGSGPEGAAKHARTPALVATGLLLGTSILLLGRRLPR
jgi:hypothetical protein